MGYRKLLKSYIRYANEEAGRNLLQQDKAQDVFSQRDLGELRSLSAEIHREIAVEGDLDPEPTDENNPESTGPKP